jgi:putative oxidoreductase
MPPLPGYGNDRFAISVGLLVLRAALAWIFIYHGSGKLFGAFGGPGIEGFAKGMQDMPLLAPTVWATIVGVAEFGSGLLMAAGLFSRFAALVIIVVMTVAIGRYTGGLGFAGTGAGYQFNMLIIAASMVILLVGAGLVSVDAILFKRGLWARGPQPLG